LSIFLGIITKTGITQVPAVKEHWMQNLHAVFFLSRHFPLQPVFTASPGPTAQNQTQKESEDAGTFCTRTEMIN
jgi:hypothetical protein